MTSVYGAIADASFHAGIILALLDAAESTEDQNYMEAYLVCAKEHTGPLLDSLETAMKEGAAE